MAELLPFALILLAGYLALTLARPLWVPVAGVALGALALGWLTFLAADQPCTSDPAGCAMSRGYEGLALMAAGFILLSAALAAAFWRLSAGRQAGLGPRLLAALLVPLVLAGIAAAIFL